MTWKEELSEIESHEFAARLNVVSSMREFFSAAGKEPTVISLYAQMLLSDKLREEVLNRIRTLSQLEVDHRYENPKDTTLAILLWLMAPTTDNPNYVQMAALLVDRTPQCWYAKKLARRILTPPPVASGDSQISKRASGIESSGTSSGDITLNQTSETSDFIHWPCLTTNIGESQVADKIIEVVH